ncbi:DUF4054 domain-containing protein [Burkholderia gladioli]|uniref:DUF4054 domain-containing protein n=1 Tax=Burkholderia gladioli TaxID=28095 RepID=UPI0009B8F18E|nr:DUF4054 domain-containing protein [Burkholderia gladioli]
MSGATRSTALRVADVRTRFATASAPFDDVEIKLAIEDTRPYFDRTRWGDFYQRAACVLVMHFLATGRAAGRSRGKPSMPATSKKAGEVQASYAVPSIMVGDDAWLAATTWGQEYLQLRRIVGAGGLVV